MANVKTSTGKNTRNFALHLSPQKKEALKQLAAESSMTLTDYIENVIREAIENKDAFEKIVIKKRD